MEHFFPEYCKSGQFTDFHINFHFIIIFYLTLSISVFQCIETSYLLYKESNKAVCVSVYKTQLYIMTYVDTNYVWYLQLFSDYVTLCTVDPYTDVVQIYDLNINVAYDRFL